MQSNASSGHSTGRSLDGLSDKVGLAARAFDAVEQSFDGRWLNQKAGKHILQLLWGRKDRLSTVELYTLGCALIRVLEESHDAWLKRIVKKIKSSSTPHGLLSEVLVFGALSIDGKALKPSPPNHPGFDFSHVSANAIKYRVSVKNHDATKSSKAFNRNAKVLRLRWKERLKTAGRNLGLHVIASEPLSESDFCLIYRAARQIPLHPKSALQILPQLTVKVTGLPFEGEAFSQESISDLVVVCAPAPVYETTRFRKNLFEASHKFKTSPLHDKVLNILVMRVHANADLDVVENIAQELMDEDGNLLDAVLLMQPTYARDPRGASLLHYACRLIIGKRYFQLATDLQIDPISFAPPIGIVSKNTARLEWTFPIGLADHLTAGTYLFQEGDIYLERKTVDGSLRGNIQSPAMGVHQHLVFRLNNRSFNVSSKGFSQQDHLLLV